MPITRCNLMSPKNSDMVNELVTSIKGLTKGEKLAAIKAIFQNIHTIANALDETRPDVAKALDAILTGNSVSTKNLQPRFLYGIIDNFIYRFDSAEGTVTHTSFKTGKVVAMLPVNDDEVFNTINQVRIRTAIKTGSAVPTRTDPNPGELDLSELDKE